MDRVRALIGAHTAEDFDIFEPYYQLRTIQLILQGVTLPDWFEQNVAFSEQSLDEMSAESETWLRQINRDMENTLVSAGPVTAEDIQAFREGELRLNSQGTQPQETRSALHLLGISTKSRMPRIEGMPLSVSLRFWQPIGIATLIQFGNHFKGALLADIMGLGKTVQIIGHLLAVCILG